MTRKSFLGLSLLVILALAGPVQAAQSPQVPLAPNVATWQFAQPLPLLEVAGGTIWTEAGNQPLTVRMCEFRANVLPAGAVAGYAGTWVWGYLTQRPGANTCASLVDLYDDGVLNGTSGPLDTFTGPVILSQRGSSTEITWVNDLGTADATNVLAYKYSTDQTMHWADPLNGEMNMCNHMAMYPEFGSECAQNYAGPVPAVVHLHGGEVPPEIDGGPDAWFTSDGAYQGHGYYTRSAADAADSAVYAYPNTQEASPAWVHDHTLGATRLNVYAGLAGAYLISDPDLGLPAGLSAYGLSRGGVVGADEFEIPLVIQDRMFDTNGQLFFPADSAGGLLWTPNPEHPYWVPEFSGDTILVNGKTWPYLDVEPKRYRFLFLNGSNARTYEMNLIDPLKVAVAPNFWVIGTDGGYLDTPVLARKLTMMPGERYEVIVDFSVTAPGTNLVLKNTAKTPFPAGVAPQGATTALIMQFRVGACASGNCGATDTSFDPAAAGAVIRTAGQSIVRLPGTVGGPAIVTSPAASRNVHKTRQLTLNESMAMASNVIDPVTGLPTAYPGGPLEVLVNNTKWGGERITGVDSTGHYIMEPVPGFTGVTLNGTTTYYSELPQEGDSEIWEIVNITADAHPIHLHLVQFQIVERQAFNASNYIKAYEGSFPGGGYDPMTGQPYPAGVYIPGFGPPLDYDPALNPVSGGKFGGNPDVYALNPKNGRPLYLQGKPAPADTNERGWKDTVIAYPGQVTRIVVRWAPTDLAIQTGASGTLDTLFYPFDPGGDSQHGYVWHCHIIDHEDNEMMRPDLVILNAAAPVPADRRLVKGFDY